jgi:hypothetical protein
MLIFLPLLVEQTGWATTYERSGFLETGSYEEAVDYCRRLERSSKMAKVIEFGTSPEGRPMIALLISRDREHTPEAVARSRKPLVFINNGIHSGEIEGKDSSLIMARDILVTGKEAALIDRVNLMIVPVFSVDAHERFSAYNRINQNGPKEMGWRATSRNLNLNRDFIKADALEMRNMLRLLDTWRPSFFFDNHTTNGADYQYQVTLGVPVEATLAQPLAEWSRKMFAAVQPRIESDGFPVAPYFGLRDRTDPTKGITVEDYSPRFSTGYMSARNRPSMLVETHMLKPYKERVESTYSTNKRTIEYISETADQLKSAIAQVERTESGLVEGQEVVLEVRRTPATRPFTFKGFKHEPRQSEVTGRPVSAWVREPVDFSSSIADQFEPSVTVKAPAAFAIPPQWTEVIDLLAVHGIKYDVLGLRRLYEVKTYRLENVKFGAAPFESRFLPQFNAVAIQELRTLPPGTAIVRTDQVGARLILHMLMPEGPDSLARWGFFNAMFEQKEYFEDYAMEPIAAEMLRRDAKLKAEFEERLKDPEFAGSPQARLRFFYERSPYMDKWLNKYPVALLTKEQVDTLVLVPRK